MRHPCLDLLSLTEDELHNAKRHVQEMAYFKWQNSGCPDDGALQFWYEAELEWIEYHYVPHRKSSRT